MISSERICSVPARKRTRWTVSDVELVKVPKGTRLSILFDGEEGDEVSERKAYYYQFCLPGCLPDSDWFGPFPSRTKAIADMKDVAGWYN